MSVSMSTRIQWGPYVIPRRQKGTCISFLSSLLFSRIKSGDGACVFIGDFEVIVDMGLRHGLVFEEGLTMKEMIHYIIYHVIMGECYANHRNAYHETKLGNEFWPLICTTVAAGRSSSAELCAKFVHHILSYGGHAVSE